MRSNHPTVRTSIEPTVEDKTSAGDEYCAVSRIMAYWRNQTDADVMGAIEAFPSLLENKSLLIDLALKDFQQQCKESPVEIDEYCGKFQRFGSSIEQSIFRALEVQAYFDAHPELLDLIAKFDWPNTGEELEGFQVVEELGRGALARVYLCREVGVGGREVVVKVARNEAYEAELLGRLDHPNIVPIYSVTNDPNRGASYICMPYRGRSTLLDLVDALQRGESVESDRVIWEAARRYFQSPDQQCSPSSAAGPAYRRAVSYVDGVIRLAVRLSSALSHAHERGIYHGDLKPSNVLLMPDTAPLLIDFNLATDLRRQTVPRGGTLAYMPPEQLRDLAGTHPNTASQYDARSEIYSFGALLYHLFTGEVPYPVGDEQCDPAELARQMVERQEEQSPSIRKKNRHVNVSLERIILNCIAIKPEHRPQSMADLQKRLTSESNLAAKVRRLAISRPYVARCMIAGALACGILSMIALVQRPPYDQRQFLRGQTLQMAGRFDDARASFNRAIHSNPSNYPAKYERARTKLLQFEYDDAVEEFSRLWKDYSDPRCAAYAGYCFNLQRNPSSAIPWYELAITHGLTNVGVHNNLGISYARGRSHAGHLERFDLAEHHLKKALSLDGKSLEVRANLVETALMRAEVDPGFDVEPTVVHLNALQEMAPERPPVSTYAVYLYSTLYQQTGNYKDNAFSAIAASIRLGARPSISALEKSPKFAGFRGDSRFEALCKQARSSSIDTPETLATFINPVSGIESRPSY